LRWTDIEIRKHRLHQMAEEAKESNSPKNNGEQVEEEDDDLPPLEESNDKVPVGAANQSTSEREINTRNSGNSSDEEES
jgi:hypothetical protein